MRRIIAEMYKSMPKKLKEDKDIDKLLRDPKGYMSIGKNEDQQEKQMDFGRKSLEIEELQGMLLDMVVKRKLSA